MLHEVTIKSLNHSGQGVCHIDGKVCFVDKALPGDRLSIRLIEEKQSYATAEIASIIKASADRITPHCPLADRCGGCQLQHLSYPAQLHWKRQSLIDQLTHITGLDREHAQALCGDTLASPDTWAYRNKVQFPVGGTVTNPEIGFFEPRSHRIVDGDVCPVQPEVSNRLRLIVRQWLIRHQIKPYNEINHSGMLRHIMTRVGFETREVMLVLVLNTDKCPENLREIIESDLISEVQTACRDLSFAFKSFYLNYQPKAGNLILGRQFVLLWGDEFIYDELLGLRYRISPGSFFQINPAQTKQLYQEALRAADLQGHERVYDLYCGTGSISLLLAKYAKSVIGIELFPAAIIDAKANAEINAINNTSFYTGAAEKVVPQLYKKSHVADVVVVDPPRKGCDAKLLSTMLDMAPRKIVYVSCNPATLARDLKILLANGAYKLNSVQPVDMFPWTSHVETVVLMSRVDK